MSGTRTTLIHCSSPDRGPGVFEVLKLPEQPSAPGGSALPLTTELAMLACYRHPHTRS